MQCRCKRIAIVRKATDRMQDKSMREICDLLMNGFSKESVRLKLKLPIAVFEMFINEIKRLLLDAGFEVRRL
jgi:hypothetical protein